MSAGGESGAAADAVRDAGLLEETADELYEHAPVGYVSSLPDGTIVKVNETLLQWTGQRREDIVGRKRLRDLLGPGARIYYETHYAPLLRMQGTIREIAVELVCGNGRRLPVLMNSTLVSDEHGEPRAVRTTIFDASERRRYEGELLQARAAAEARARAALALAHVIEGVLLVGTDGRIDAINGAAEEIFSVGPGSVVGRPVTDVIPEWERLVAGIRVGEPAQRPTPATVPLARGRHERWLSMAGVDSGAGVVYTIRDVTAEHGLEQLRNDMVAIVSHELRTPLTGTYGAAQTLLARYGDLNETQHRDLLGLIVGQSERLIRIVDQILLTSRLDTGNFALELAVFDGAAVAASVAEGVTSAERARVVVEAAAGSYAQGDENMARQVVTNLVDNALKYSAGEVRVRVAPERSVIRFTVADDGPGIPPPQRERIFEKFYRLDPGQYTGVGGTGLGLYIAKELVARMDGRIGLLPREGGTTVYVDLPRADRTGEER